MTPSIKRRSDVLDEVRNAVCKDRCATHGDAEDNFKDIALLWNWWLRARRGTHVRLDELDVAEMMNLMKSTRKATTPYCLDHWVDGAGYNVCGAGIVKAASDAADASQQASGQVHHCYRCATQKVVRVVEKEWELCSACKAELKPIDCITGNETPIKPDTEDQEPYLVCLMCNGPIESAYKLVGGKKVHGWCANKHAEMASLGGLNLAGNDASEPKPQPMGAPCQA